MQSSYKFASVGSRFKLAYTRAMMGGLMFMPRARDFLMIGLGGGSLAKFIHRRLPRARVTAVEINAQVLIAARTMFGVPRDGKRFTALLGDGAKVGAGSVVLEDVPPHTTVAGVPAKVVGRPSCDQPALEMDHDFCCDEVAAKRQEAS